MVSSFRADYGIACPVSSELYKPQRAQEATKLAHHVITPDKLARDCTDIPSFAPLRHSSEAAERNDCCNTRQSLPGNAGAKQPPAWRLWQSGLSWRQQPVPSGRVAG